MNNIIHELKIADKQDRDAILLFLKEHWNENHVYLKSDKLFDYDFLINDSINFILALNAENKIDGILGFIQYSPEYQNSDICTVLWKVRPKNGNPSLGMTILNNLINNFGFRVVSTVGANPRTLPIYEFLGYNVGKLNHYFILNKTINAYRIIGNASQIDHPPAPVSLKKALIHYNSYDDFISAFDPKKYQQYSPYKSPWYINKRYFNHPIYNYNVFGIMYEGIIQSVLITREIQIDNCKILRIVDFLGDEEGLVSIKEELETLLYKNAYEYVDFYQYGISSEIMEKAGFILKNDSDTIIIPNYFEPFENKNVNINFFTTDTSNFRIFKGDGDQDRPSLI